MSADASRIEKVEVSFSFRGIGQRGEGVATEKDARDLMHALATALGYTCTPLVKS